MCIRDRDDGARVPDVVWLRPDGRTMQPEDWDSGFGRAIGMFLNGQGIREQDRQGRPITDQNFLVYFNSGDDGVDLMIPDARYGESWDVVVDTAGDVEAAAPLTAGDSTSLGAGSMLVLRETDTAPTVHDDSVEASLRMQIELAETPAPAPLPETRR